MHTREQIEKERNEKGKERVEHTNPGSETETTISLPRFSAGRAFSASPRHGCDFRTIRAPISTWEQYLVASTGSPNPDAAEQALRERAMALDLVDARFIGLEHLDEAGQPTGYSVGCLEVYREGGNYLELGRFEHAQGAVALVDALQVPLDNGELAPHAVHEWAEFAAQALDVPVQWREAEREHLVIDERYAQQEQELTTGPEHLGRTEQIPGTGDVDF